MGSLAILHLFLIGKLINLNREFQLDDGLWRIVLTIIHRFMLMKILVTSTKHLHQLINNRSAWWFH